MFTRNTPSIILFFLFIGLSKITLSKITEVYISDMYKYRILSAKGIIIDAPMVKDKATKNSVSKSLQDGWGYSGSEAKKILNGLEKDGQPEWIQDGISAEDEKVIQTLNGFNILALSYENRVLEFFPSVNEHVPAEYKFKKPFCLVVQNYFVVLRSDFNKIQQTADTSKQTKNIQAYTNYPIQLNKLNTYKESTTYYVSRPPDLQIKAARMKRLFKADSTEFLRSENANIWPKGVTTLSTENLAKLKAYYLFSYWVNKTEYLYIRIPGKENSVIFPEIGFLPNHDLYYTVENNRNYITWIESKPPKDFRIKNIIEVMQKALVAYVNHSDYRDLYKKGSSWDVNTGGSMIPTELYVLEPRAAGQVIFKKSKLDSYQFMVPLEKSADRYDAEQTAYQLAFQVAEEVKLFLKPNGEPIEFYQGVPRKINGGLLYILEYKNEALLGNNKFQVFSIMSINDVVWLSYVFRNEITGYLF